MLEGLILPVYEVEGNNYEVGYRVGKRFKTQITKVLEQNKRLRFFRKLEEREPRFQKLVKVGERYFPKYMEEIRGIADGSGSSLKDIYRINFRYDYPRKGCTTVIFKEPSRIILAHNEDGLKENFNKCYLLKVRPEGGTPFISFCYPGMIPGNAFAFNAYGIIITTNSMPTPDIRITCPRHLIDRAQLEQKNIKDVIKGLLFQERASGGSFNIVSQKEKRAMNIETTSLRYCITEVESKNLHSNHYVSRGLRSIKKDKSLLRSSISRYKVGSKLLSRVREKTPQAALDILSSLEAKPYSILMMDGRRRGRTLATVLFEVTYDGITMRIYEPRPNMQENEIFLPEFTLDDLKNF